MNAIELLEKDHRTVEELFAEIEELKEDQSAERRRLFDRIRTELMAHETIEEEIFYPALARSAETREIVLEGYQEHHIADVQLEEIAQLSPTDEMWAVKVKVLKETIEHHIEEEEGEMFKAARRVFDESELMELGERMEERRRSAQAELNIPA